MADFNQNVVFNGLGTFSTGVNVAGNYFVDGQVALPTLVNGGGASSVLAVVNLNGSPVYTGTAGASGFKALVLDCDVGDTISVVLSSAAAADLPLNVIKTAISIGMGE